MNRNHYMAMKHWFLSHTIAYETLKILYSSLPVALVIFYPVMVIIKAVMGFDGDFVKMLCVPAGVLIVITVIRKLLNRPRPYEKFATSPLLRRDGKGCSMPSRHTASAFIIAMSGFLLSVPVGVTLLCVATIIAATRVFAGVHYISDVIIGMLISVITGLIFFVF